MGKFSRIGLLVFLPTDSGEVSPYVRNAGVRILVSAWAQLRESLSKQTNAAGGHHCAMRINGACETNAILEGCKFLGVFGKSLVIDRCFSRDGAVLPSTGCRRGLSSMICITARKRFCVPQ